MALRKVQPGDRFHFPAEAYNSLVDLDRRARESTTIIKRPVATPQKKPDTILIRNSTGSTLPRFGVVGLGSPAILPSVNLDSFTGRVLLNGVAPSDDYKGKFAVLAEPAIDEAVVKAYVSGVFPAIIKMDDESHGFADVIDGVATYLGSAASGAAEIIWKDDVEDRDDPEIAWAVVRVGGVGGGEWFYAQIGGYRLMGTFYHHWWYTWDEVTMSYDDELDDVISTVVAGGRVGTATTNMAMNLREVNNVEEKSGRQGDSLDHAIASGAIPPLFRLQPVGGEPVGIESPRNPVIVRMYPTSISLGPENGVIHEFEYENSTSGPCLVEE